MVSTAVKDFLRSKGTYASRESVHLRFVGGGSRDAPEGGEDHAGEREESELGLHGYCCGADVGQRS